MNLIKDDKLIESYLLAIDLELEADFLQLLITEIHRRNIRVGNESPYHLPYNGYAS